MNIWKMTTYNVGSTADHFLHIETIEDLEKLSNINEENIIIFGWGSNILLAKKHYKNTSFIKFDLEWDWEKTGEDGNNLYFNIYVWEHISKFIAKSLEYTNTFNPLYWLPGNIWGSMIGNTWSFGTHMWDFVESIYGYDFKGKKFVTIEKKELNFKYRYSSLILGSCLIIKANIRVPKNYKSNIHHYIEYAKQRIEVQPVWNSCGKYFYDPKISPQTAAKIMNEFWIKEEEWNKIFTQETNTISVKWLIEKAWLKWYEKNWVQISTLHPNFLMNIWTNNGQDIVDMGNYIKKVIKEKFDIELIEEVRIII